jgi:hypothetical protein
MISSNYLISSCKEICLEFCGRATACAFWDVSRFPSFRIIPVCFLPALSAVPIVESIHNLYDYCTRSARSVPNMRDISYKLIERSPELLNNTATILLVLDLLGVFPYQTCRIALDSLYLLTGTVNSVHTLNEGISRVVSIGRDRSFSTTEKLKKLVSGGLFVVLGTWCLSRTFTRSIDLYEGSKLLDSLSPMQQEGVLKHRAIHTLAMEKGTNAVIIDGISLQWGGVRERLIGGMPLSFSELTYENADTQFYRVNSSASFCSALEDASRQFGEKIQNLEILGHGMDGGGNNSNQMIQLSADYFFKGSKEEVTCMQQYLSNASNLFLIACNSATKTATHSISIAQKTFESLPHTTVTGFNSFFNPTMISAWIGANGTLQLQSHFFSDMNDFLVFPLNRIIYSRGRG